MMSLLVWPPGPMLLLGSLSLVPGSFQGVSVQEGLYRGGGCSLSRSLCRETPDMVDKQVVHILL